MSLITQGFLGLLLVSQGYDGGSVETNSLAPMTTLVETYALNPVFTTFVDMLPTVAVEVAGFSPLTVVLVD
jgi:hypothetical protein